jgi:hypothetical protein
LKPSPEQDIRYVRLVRFPASYYIQASESGREPPGRWWGPGAQALGLEPGQRIEREPYDLLFGERKVPDGTQLGRLPGEQYSATQTRSQALADADHLAILHAIWTAETTPARDQRYRDLLMGALPPGYRRQPGHQAKWLWRTMRAAELAGLDPALALAAAIAERDLAGSRDIAAVLDARLRHRPFQRHISAVAAMFSTVWCWSKPFT